MPSAEGDIDRSIKAMALNKAAHCMGEDGDPAMPEVGACDAMWFAVRDPRNFQDRKDVGPTPVLWFHQACRSAMDD